MKNFKYILSLLVITSLFMGCDDNDVEPIGDESSKPTVTAFVSSGSVNESGSPIVTITINLDKPIKTTTTFEANLIGGTASEDDFSTELAVVPAYQTSTTMEVVINDDIEIEETETILLEIVPNNVSDLYEVLEQPTVSIEILNSTSDDFIFKLDWDVTYVDSDGDPHSLCDMDFDLEIYTEALDAIIATSYSSCPEQITIPAGALADGNYWLVPSFWSTAGAVPPATDFDVPAVVTLSQPGVALETVELTGLWNTGVGGFQQGNPNAYLVKYVLTISGTDYTVTDADTGDVIFQN